MLYVATAITSLVLLVLTILQTIYVLRYRSVLKSGLREQNANESDDIVGADGEPVALILCLRGVDPTLRDCLTGIMCQDHPNFQLHIVFDHCEDPAVAYAEEFFHGSAVSPTVHFNTEPLETCTLKCSGLVKVIGKLPDATEYIALIDADTVADENWLIDLLAPFVDPDIGATTGNRWFTPREPNVGTVFRKVWNAAAVPQVTLYNIGWGGSLAFRHRVVQEAKLLDRMRTAFCEDTMVAEKLASVDMRLHRVPSLIMENTESTTLGDAFRWITRQTLTVRLHHRMWPLVLAHGILTAFACYVTPVLAFVAICAGQYANAATLARFFLLYQIFNVGLLVIIDWCNKEMIASRIDGNPTEVDHSTFWGNVLAAILNQYLFPLAVYRAWKSKSVHWRGIEYLIDTKNRLKMKKFVPYRDIIRSEQLEQVKAIAESIQ